MKITYLTITAIFLIANLLAQDQELEEKLDFLKENTVPVKDKRTEYRQTFSYDPENYLLLSISIVDSRKGEEIIMSVNAIDINPFLVKFEPSKEVVEITAGTNGGRDLVKVVEDGEIQNYDDELVFYASGIEEARQLADALKAVAEYAKDNSESLISVSNDKQTLLNEIDNAIQEVKVNDDVYVQEFSFDSENNNIVTFKISNATGDEVEQFTVNIADLNLHKIDFETDREEVVIPVVTKGERDLIAYTENGETGNYTNELELKVNSIEEARMLEAQLEALVALAEKEETVDYSSFSYQQCLDILQNNIGQVVINQDAYDQEFEISPDNDLVFIYTLNDVSEGEKYEYVVNAADFGKVPVNFDTDKNSVLIELKTAGDRELIRVTENNEDVDYESEMKIRSPDVETAREVAAVFSRFNQLALEKMEKSVAFPDVSEAENYVLSAVADVVVETDTYQQSLEKGSSECLLKYNLTDVSDDTRYVYEFNLKDVDVNKIHFETDGAEALVTIQIKGENDLVQVYENGEADDFTDEFQIKAKDLEQARKLETAFKMMTESCMEN
ncbi:hypothetical protein SAMN05444280_107102 [Tangfeifania diversioriginum]|uniref:Uncharacterized protein n=1 Tax=Tangfeifania diversioriginum TaxID=1168035 RepID=A0A1M6ESH7_9BACT|nr:hypothetical protein [Tangfeifania diversioriginum]SHI88355.1 hypothetical protein SAMN05444280_107102 [Tangfeifania diversioriginum]